MGKQSLVSGLLLTLFVSAVFAAPPSEVLKSIDKEIDNRPGWIEDARQCPSAFISGKGIWEGMSSDECMRDASSCFSRCAANEAAACYWLGVNLERYHVRLETPAALFQRACKLGLMSGCTNRAAGMEAAEPKNETVLSCAATTYQLACDKGEVWACAMFGYKASIGAGTKKNLNEARKALEKSCAIGPDSEACSRARVVESMIRNEVIKDSP